MLSSCTPYFSTVVIVYVRRPRHVFAIDLFIVLNYFHILYQGTRYQSFNRSNSHLTYPFRFDTNAITTWIRSLFCMKTHTFGLRRPRKMHGCLNER